MVARQSGFRGAERTPVESAITSSNAASQYSEDQADLHRSLIELPESVDAILLTRMASLSISPSKHGTSSWSSGPGHDAGGCERVTGVESRNGFRPGECGVAAGRASTDVGNTAGLVLRKVGEA